MYNILLDKLPDNYKGYLIRTDYRIGIQICSCLSDKSLNKEEQLMIALKLLYGNGIPLDIKLAIKGLKWFLNLGEELTEEEEKKHNIGGKQVMDFEIDANRIFSGFKAKLGIDINKVKMHWFEFRYLLLELKDCHMSDVVEIRQKEIDKNMPFKQRAAYRKLKKLYAIDDNSTENVGVQKELINYLHSK